MRLAPCHAHFAPARPVTARQDCLTHPKPVWPQAGHLLLHGRFTPGKALSTRPETTTTARMGGHGWARAANRAHNEKKPEACASGVFNIWSG